MSYNPKTNWQDSEIVHATDMNRIEQGISDADVGLGNVQAEVTAHMADGVQHAKSSKFVVGTSTSGWTSADCDYLCDGTADDVEINAAITALPVTGGEIIILDGTYNITARIDVNKSIVSIRGNGNATILKRMWNSGTYDPTEAEWSGFPEGVIHLGVSRCKIENLKIDGNNTDYPSPYNAAIYLDYSSNHTVTGNSCTNNSVGISLVSSSNNTVTGNICNNNSAGINLVSSSNNTVTGNACNYNNSVGISLVSSSTNTVTGNTCNSNGSGISLVSSSTNTITGNTCNNSSSTISHVSSGIRLGSSSSNNTITGNTCIRGTGLTTDYTEEQYTIYLMDTDNNYNLIAMNNCMGKAVTSEGGTGNTLVNNKFDELYAPADYIIEKEQIDMGGSTGIWNVTKRSDGTCEALLTVQRGNYFTLTDNGIRYTTDISVDVPPNLFISVDWCSIDAWLPNNAWLLRRSYNINSVTWVYASISGLDSTHGTVCIKLIGKWK